MKKKKLILFMPSIGGGGVEKNFVIVANHLAKKLNNTTLITSNKLHAKFFKNLKFICPIINTQNLSRRIKYFFCLIELIKLILKDNNVLVFSFQANVYCSLICKFFKINIITRSNSSPSGWKINFYRNILFKLLLSLPDKIIVNSIDFKKEFKKKFNIDAVCIYNPLNKKEIIHYSKKQIKEKFFKNYKKLKIIFIGRFVEQKDPLTFLNALYYLKKKIDFKAIMIGKGELYSEIFKFIHQNDLDQNIQLMDWKKNPYNLIKNSDILILTSKYEGLPNTLLETIALKKPIISTNCPTGPKEILDSGKGGTLCKIGDYQTIVKELLKFNRNKKIFNEKANFAFKRLERFDYNKNLDKYLKLVKEQIK